MQVCGVLAAIPSGWNAIRAMIRWCRRVAPRPPATGYHPFRMNCWLWGCVADGRDGLVVEQRGNGQLTIDN